MVNERQVGVLEPFAAVARDELGRRALGNDPPGANEGDPLAERLGLLDVGGTLGV